MTIRLSSLAIGMTTLVRQALALTSPTVISGRRCIHISLNNESGGAPNPLVVIGGTAQTIASWGHHIPTLSKNRDFMIYECIGQGSAPADLTDVSLPAQAHQLQKTLDEVFTNDEQIDFVGYSLGARIAMAYAVTNPSRVRKLHLTGVSAQPSDAGFVAVEAWKDLLRNNNLQGFAWSILQTTYDSSFLRKNSHRLAQWVQFIVNTNTSDGLLAILEQTRGLEEWNTLQMAERISGAIDGCIVVGESDQMAPSHEAQVLADKLNWRDVHIMTGCGHAAPSEEPRLWRKHVLDFLNE